ncbi:MAG: hypothetical protein A2758_00010 [Candidatus Zambryskibacteria bacterium RIFCSPHIGHO2_01_FULL_49_18]|uniref:Addiction module toxin, HicA family n=1 Tax=Candidatus Zambryskibacteria bacterium RIFCSPHIGHO2_01_FULL_49_18 TaxID=1802740 RepID=A0A1G2T3X8_9BACT|nr:MAG: hypothetical protein A2758_00010 [Candidatus Zambryskibacteria bacterium RIFCSPHIGHO2_01_FULL_49_18]
MTALPKLNAKQIIAALGRAGFVLSRQSGSHKIYKNRIGKRVTVPFHSSKVLHPKLIKSILRDADLTIEKFLELI